MIGDLLAIMVLFLIAFVFWQQRRQAELAKEIATRRCKQLDLQLLSIALKGHYVKMPDGRWCWHSIYQFEFSSLGDDYYQGQLVMRGLQLIRVQVPPHRM
ncbi:hypothetical protein GCM10007938_10980 [Vibrio zhanjiangensis]|uniref:DUF3301 domain-containing protein n=1 Tax=Vibrio zhanjiangensis TaxID=1046128 RepID=A0ABQ6EX65_9VIBR|nr:DUF3301 domain-containing protein [Vibrio zhanjiangensis]GLT17321.1 hypothetical protein GCM10007938_10980 [Vibrio zhanjiangensis]